MASELRQSGSGAAVRRVRGLLDYEEGKLLRSGNQRWKLQQLHSAGVCKRLHGIDEVALKDRTFTQDDGNETNVYQYFVDNYPQFKDIDPNKPGIKVGEAKGDRCAPVVPIELLTFAPGQARLLPALLTPAQGRAHPTSLPVIPDARLPRSCSWPPRRRRRCRRR